MNFLSHDFQFYITRYPFPNGLLTHQNHLYKTSYQSQHSELSSQKISRLTSLNRLPSLIKLKQIVKTPFKPNLHSNVIQTQNITHSYSLYYEIVPNFILSSAGISVIKLLSKQERIKMFKTLIEDIQTLMSYKIFYILDVQNIGISMIGKVKIYVPANNIIEKIQFTEKHQKEMKSAAIKVIACLQRHINNFISTNQHFDVQRVKHQIRKELQNLQSINQNIVSKQFTFNQNQLNQNQYGPQYAFKKQKQIPKALKLRKSTQNIHNALDITINDQLNNTTSFQTLKYDYNQKCITTRENLQRFDFQPNKNQQQKQNEFIALRENEILRQKMKTYEIKLNELNQTVKLMKQQILQRNIQKNKKRPKKDFHDRIRSKTFMEFQNPLYYHSKNSDEIKQKLQTSRIEIKRLLLNDSNLKHSYHIEEDEKQRFGHEMETQENQLKREIENVLNDNQFKNQIETNKQTYNNNSNLDRQQSLKINDNMVKNYKQSLRLEEIKEEKSNSQSKQQEKSKKGPSSFNQESSLGKYSQPGGNPFRQYGNFRIEYFIDEQSKPNNSSNNINESGKIKVYHEVNNQLPKPIKQTKKHHLPSPLSYIQQNFRYSSLAIQKGLRNQLEPFFMPENIYDPTEYDSMDTYQMEVNKDDKMPQIISKTAFRHTLFPTPFFGKIKPTKDVQENQEKPVVQKQEKSPRQNRSYKSVDRKTQKQSLQTLFKKEQDNLSQRKSKLSLQITPQLLMKKEIIKPSKDINVVQSKNIQGQKKLVQIQKQDLKKQKKQERVLRINNQVPRFMNIDFSPDKDSVKNKKQKILTIGQKKSLDREKIKSILNKSKQIITKYKNFPTKRQ